MADNAETARAKAEARFQKEQKRAQEGEQSRLDRVAAAKAIDVKGARLRALRLAKEADAPRLLLRLRSLHRKPRRAASRIRAGRTWRADTMCGVPFVAPSCSM